jgi:hypothetical protein
MIRITLLCLIAVNALSTPGFAQNAGTARTVSADVHIVYLYNEKTGIIDDDNIAVYDDRAIPEAQKIPDSARGFNATTVVTYGERKANEILNILQTLITDSTTVSVPRGFGTDAEIASQAQAVVKAEILRIRGVVKAKAGKLDFYQLPSVDPKPEKQKADPPKTKAKSTTFSYNNNASKDEIIAADIRYKKNGAYAFSMYGTDMFGAMIATRRDVTDFETYDKELTYRKTSAKQEQQVLQEWSSRIDGSIADAKTWEQAYQPIREKNTKAYAWTENWRADFNQRLNQHLRNQDYALSLRRVSEDTGSFFDEGKYHYEDSNGKRYTRAAYKNIVAQRLADSDRLNQERAALQQRLNSDAQMMEQNAALEKQNQEQLDRSLYNKGIYNLGYKSLMNSILSHE